MANINGVNPPVLNDVDYVQKIKNSLDAIDAHDHTSTKGLQIPTAGIEDNAITAAKIDDNAVGSDAIGDLTAELTMAEIATPSTPATGYVKIYPKTDGKFYQLDDTGAETVVGDGLDVDANDNVYGPGEIPGTLTGNDNTAIGVGALSAATTSAADNTAVGHDAGNSITTGTENTMIGVFSDTNSATDTQATAVGKNAVAGQNAVSVGFGASAAGGSATAVGPGSSAGHSDAVAIGKSSQSTKASQMVVGSATAPVTEVVVGDGATAVTPSNVTHKTSGGSGTDRAGGDYIIAPGEGTGTGTGGEFVVKTALATTTGSSLNTSEERFRVKESGAVNFAPLTSAERTAITGAQGDFVYDSTLAKPYHHNGSAWVEFGSGAGGGTGTNYIGNGDAETDTTGWAQYIDAAAVKPVDGEGGSPSAEFVIARTTTASEVQRGTASFKLTKAAGDQQGAGIMYEWDSTENADLARVLKISFDYDASDASYSDGDLRAYIISSSDNFAADFNVIEPAPTEILGGTGTYTGYFQTDASDTDYRLCFHVAGTTTAGFDVFVDSVRVESAPRTFGPVVTDWADYTPSLVTPWNDGTIQNQDFRYRRIGDSIEVMAYFEVNSAPTAGTFTFNPSEVLPSGIDFDSTKTSTFIAIGVAATDDVSAGTGSDQQSGTVYVTKTGNMYVVDDSNGVDIWNATTSPFAWESGDQISFKFSLPIQGWSSSTQMSDDGGDTRVVVFRGQESTANQTIPDASDGGVVPSVLEADVHETDTHAAWRTGTSYNSTTGAWTTEPGFVVPVTGYYHVSGYARTAATGMDAHNDTMSLRLRVDGSDVRVFAKYSEILTTAVRRYVDGTALVYATKGQVINHAISIDYRDLDSSWVLEEYYVDIHKVQGPAQIAASEVVAATYEMSGTMSNTPTGEQYIDFATKIKDTHNAVVGAGNDVDTVYTNTWRFIAPSSGKYLVSWSLMSDPTNFSATGLGKIWLVTLTVDGSPEAIPWYYEIKSVDATTFNINGVGTSLIELNKGQALSLRSNQNWGSLGWTGGDKSRISIHRIGGVG